MYILYNIIIAENSTCQSSRKGKCCCSVARLKCIVDNTANLTGTRANNNLLHTCATGPMCEVSLKQLLCFVDRSASIIIICMHTIITSSKTITYTCRC